MKKELFHQLLYSVREGGAVLSGSRKPARAFHLKGPDVRLRRRRYGLSQAEFAAIMDISVGTLRRWEQGRRKPEPGSRHQRQ
jgi:putative transcriptional regulator